MRKFMTSRRRWGREGGPDEDWVRPHVLWLPQDQPRVITYFERLREITSRYPDIVAPVAADDLHMTIQSIRAHTADGTRVDAALIADAADAVRHELADLDPFTVEIGPARAGGSAALAEIWPEHGPDALYRRVRTALTAAGLELPPAEDHFWCHMSAGYGVQDTDTPHLAALSDRLASDLGRAIRPGIRTTATIASVWLVWERQHPDTARYTFERLHEVPLGTP
ncbi:2'-5' RNA ligase family protein [Kitasatospora sp. NPDC098663]|uniref:2'-5' RNA ligase family protein n=1 Tax=Kitasatospora sp. NPDC098663 TaxID=3364096 RepID=UPI0038148F96